MLASCTTSCVFRLPSLYSFISLRLYRAAFVWGGPPCTDAFLIRLRPAACWRPQDLRTSRVPGRSPCTVDFLVRGGYLPCKSRLEGDELADCSCGLLARGGSPTTLYLPLPGGAKSSKPQPEEIRTRLEFKPWRGSDGSTE